MSADKRCSDKEIRYNASARKYEIIVNGSYYKGFFVFFFVMGIIMGCTSIPVILYDQMYGFILAAVLSVPFFLFGLRAYYFSTLRDQGIVIDLQKKVIAYSSSLVIPFKTIKHISLEETGLFEPKVFFIKKVKAIQVAIEDHRGNKAVLFRSEETSKFHSLMKEISVKIGIPLKKS